MSYRLWEVCSVLFLIALSEANASTIYTYTTLDNPNADVGSTFATAINDSGQVTVNFQDANGSHYSFVYNGVIYTTIGPANAQQAFAYGINNSGQVTGNFQGTTGGHGFVYNCLTYTTLDHPNALLTEAFGINNQGQVTGYFLEATGEHGFVASPVPVPAAVWLFGSALAGLGFSGRTKGGFGA